MLRRAMPDATPIDDAELDQLFAGLCRYSTLVLAVSGGADSMALMHLLARWRPRRPKISIHIATVDHDLRPGSRAEADAVAAAAARLGFDHHLLTWTGDKPITGLQDAARNARYDLIGGLLRTLASADAALVTAHTADDQAETLLMRLARGSGLDGLAAMRDHRPLHAGSPFDLVRPLLAIPKSRLVATLQSTGTAWTEDPSNSRLEFERVRIRAAHQTLADLGLTADKLALTARRLARVRTAIDATASHFETDVLDLNSGAFAAMRRQQFAAAPAELRLRLLLRILARYGGSATPARLAKVEALTERLSGEMALTSTLGGCVVTATAGAIRIFREPGRHGLPQCAIVGNAPILWDGRFVVAADRAPGPADAITVRALGIAGYATLRRTAERAMPARAAATLPAIWQGDTLVAVPLLALDALAPSKGGKFRFRTDFLGLPDHPRIYE